MSSVIIVSTAAAVTSNKPSVSNFKVTPLTLNYSGGSITLSATVKNATRCIFTTTPAVAGVYKNIACSSGKVTYIAKLPENSTTKNTIYTFKLIVTGKKGDGNVTAPLKTVTVVSGPNPVITSFTTSNSELSSSGGIISLTGVVINETSCRISANPAIQGTSSNPVSCSSGSAIASVAMPPNATALNINYSFTLTVTGISGATATKILEVTVDSNPPATTTTTTTTTPPSTTSGNKVGVPAEPDAFVKAGNDIWVASCSGNSVTEINENTKQIVNEINNYVYGLNCPDSLAFDGTNIWVANYLGNSLTEINASTGGLIRVLTGSTILNPKALAINGANIWSLNGNPNLNKAVLSEFNTSSGTPVNTLIDKLSGNGWTLVSPTCIVSVGNDIWVADSGAFEFNSSTGAFLRTLKGGQTETSCITYSSGYLWVSNGDNKTLLEYNASTGSYVKEIVNVPFVISNLISTGPDLFVISENPGDSVREYSTASGTVLKVIDRSGLVNGKGIKAIFVDGTTLWAANYTANTVSYFKI